MFPKRPDSDKRKADAENRLRNERRKAAEAKTSKSSAQQGNQVLHVGSLTDPARPPGDFGRDIGDEVDMWI